MKNFLVVLLLVSLIFVGCQSSGTAETPTNEKPNEETPAIEEVKPEVEEKSAPGHGHMGGEEETVEIKFETMPKKIVAGTIGVTEIFDVLGVDLVGVPSSSSYSVPDRYSDLPTVGMSMQPDAEIIKSLGTDLFVSVTSLQSTLEPSLEAKSIDTLFVNASGYDDIAKTIENLGSAFMKNDEAKAFIDNMHEVEANVAKQIEGKDKKTVMIIFGTAESFMLATDMSYMGDLANRLGLENVTDEMKAMGPYVPFSIENVVSTNPDVILRFTHADPETSKKMFEKEFAENPVWQALDSVKEGRVYDLDPHYFGVVANIRCAEALQQLANIIYGE